ncbi:MAG: hypothetical protein GXP35_17695 [Actinobacteria bacterium]|nr:hypothetical protein [Actinomycetota bacterium]
MKHKATRTVVGFGIAVLLPSILVLGAMRVGSVELVGVFMMLPAVILASLIVTSNSEATSP